MIYRDYQQFNRTEIQSAIHITTLITCASHVAAGSLNKPDKWQQRGNVVIVTQRFITLLWQ